MDTDKGAEGKTAPAHRSALLIKLSIVVGGCCTGAYFLLVGVAHMAEPKDAAVWEQREEWWGVPLGIVIALCYAVCVGAIWLVSARTMLGVFRSRKTASPEPAPQHGWFYFGLFTAMLVVPLIVVAIAMTR
jgi:hypothetical protein